jgi:hypothetical protein
LDVFGGVHRPFPPQAVLLMSALRLEQADKQQAGKTAGQLAFPATPD